MLRFYGTVTRASSVYLTTILLGRLSALSCLSVLCAFFYQRQLPFLVQLNRENDRIKYFMINLHERMLEEERVNKGKVGVKGNDRPGTLLSPGTNLR